MAVRDTPADTRLGFWSTGLAVFGFWNLATLIGALAGNAISDPSAFGLDAAAPGRVPRAARAAPAASARAAGDRARWPPSAALISVPFVPAGAPVLVAAAVAMAAALAAASARRARGGRRRAARVAASRGA